MERRQIRVVAEEGMSRRAVARRAVARKREGVGVPPGCSAPRGRWGGLRRKMRALRSKRGGSDGGIWGSGDRRLVAALVGFGNR